MTLNTEYVIIPICIPDNDTDYLQVNPFSFSIPERDDETGRLINTVDLEKEYMDKVAQIWGWRGKISFVYGFGTAGGIGNKAAAKKANEKLIERLKQFTRKDYLNAKY